MLSALLSDNRSANLGFGVASLDEQTAHQRAYSPLPQPTGELVCDPDFVLPTTAGPLPWRLFNFSSLPNTSGPFGYGWRASWPLHLCADTSGTLPTGYLVTVTLEREDGNSVQYIGNSAPGGPYPTTFTPYSPRLFDNLVLNSTDHTWDETRFDTGARFHYPSGSFASLAYYQTVLGSIVTMNYSSNGQLQNIEEPAGRLLTYLYSGDYVSTVVDWAQRAQQFEYDENDNLSSLTDQNGAVSVYQYDGSFRLSLITDPNNYNTYYAYDDQNRVISRQVDTNPPGTYDYSGSDTVYTDPLGGIWTTTLDQYGNVTQAVDPLGATRSAVFSPQGLPLEIQNALAIPPTVLTYDQNGRELTRQDPTGAIYTRTYDPTYGNLLTEQNPMGYITTHSYYGTGETRLRQATMDPLGNSTQFNYTSWGALSWVQTPSGLNTYYNWNVYGTVDTRVDALGFVRTYLYNQAGDRTTEIDELGRPVTYTFDGLSRQTSSFNNVGAFRQTLYDGAGNVQVEVDPLNNRTTYTHNAFNEVQSEQDALGHVWTHYHDVKGRPTGRMDPLANLTQTGYDSADRAIVHIDGMGRATTTTYDLARQPSGIMSPSGVITSFLYDGAGRRTARIAPTGLSDVSVYDAAGQLIASIAPTGLIHTSIYDAAGHHWALLEPTGALTTTSYDIDGRPVVETDALNRMVHVFFDGVGQPVITIDAANRIHTTTYDSSRAPLLNLSPDGTWLQHFYDPAGRAVGTLDHLGRLTTTTYDLANRVISFQDEVSNSSATLFDGLSQPVVNIDTFGNRTTVTFDPARRRIVEQDYLGNYAHLYYDYSNALTQSVDTAGNPTNFHFDSGGRVQAVEDADGYRSTRIYDIHSRISAHQDEAGYHATMVYDLFGRWAATQDAMGSLFTTNFDTFNRVVGGTDPKGYQSTRVLDLLHRPIAHIDALGYRTSVLYTSLSQIAVHTDQMGFNTTHAYDPRGNWLGAFDALGQKSTVGYDTFSRPILFQNPLGAISTTQYDGLSRIQAQVDAYGNSVTTVYDNFSRFLAQRDEDGNYTYSLYDQFGRYVATQDAQNNLNTTLYDNYGRTNGYQDQAGYKILYTFDALQRTQAVIDSLNQYTTMGYDARGNSNLTIDARNYRATSLYDPLNRLSAQVDSAGYGTTSLYDSVSNLLSLLDAQGNRSTFGYDGLRRQVFSVDSQGNTSTTIYDPRGDVLAEIDSLGQYATHLYDPLRRTIGQINKRGYITTTFYDANSRVISTLNPRGYLNSYYYDALDRQVGQQDSLGHFTTVVYDRRSNRVADVDAFGYRNTYLLDTLNRQVGQQNALGYFSTTVYNGRGLSIASIDSLNRITTTIYDELSRVKARMPADGTLWTLVYDVMGNKIADITPLGQYTTQVFDSRNRLIQRIDPLNRTQTMVYDSLNRMVASIDVKGQCTTHIFDSRGSEIGRQYADGTLVTNLYDTLRRLTKVQDSTGVYTFAYDANSNLIFQSAPSHPGGQPLTWGYDGNDNRIQRQTPWGLFQYAFDARDQIVSLSDPGSPANGTPAGTTTWTYDARKQSVRQDNPNATFSTMTYDPVMRTLQIRHATHAGAEIDHAYLSYDGAGRPIAKSTLNTLFSYGYDAVDRLLTEQAVGSAANRNTSFVYDAAGHRIGFYNQGVLTSYLYDQADQLLATQVPLSGLTYQINCGGSAASPFVADEFFSSASTMYTASWSASVDLSGVTNPAPLACYQSERYLNNGSTTPLFYTVPNLTPGASYRIRLHWASYADGGIGHRILNVQVNGVPVIKHLDVYATAGGDLKAIVKEVGGIADASGNIVLAFTSDPGNLYVSAFINAIEVILERVQINCGSTAVGTFAADEYYSSIDTMYTASWSASVDLSGVTNPAPEACYQSERYLAAGSRDALVYTIPNLVPGANYHVRLHFASYADNYAHYRVMNIAINGVLVLPGVDVFGLAGANLKAVALDAYGNADATGTLTITFTADPMYTIISPYVNAIEIINSGQTNYLYDGNGSLVSAITSQGITTYGWDAANRLQSIEVPSGYINTQTYRHDDLRVGQASVMGTETWTWDGQDVLAWTGPSNPLGGGITTATNLMVSGPNLVRSVGVNPDGSPLNRQYHLDNQGSVQALSTSIQSLEADYETDAWGNELTVNTSDNRSVYLGGLGYWQEPSLGLIYVRARWMDPMTGRWLSVDSVPTEPRYLYVGNTPTMRVDPSGRQDYHLSSGASAWLDSRAQALYDQGVQAVTSVALAVSGAVANVKIPLILTDPDAYFHTLLASKESHWIATLTAQAEKRSHHFYTQRWSETFSPIDAWPIWLDVPPPPLPADYYNDVPQLLRPFMPPTFDSPDGILYWGGFSWSAIEWFDNQIPWNSLIPHLDVFAKSEPPQVQQENKLALYRMLRQLTSADVKAILQAGIAYLKAAVLKIDKYHAGRLVGIVFFHLLDLILLVWAAYDLILKSGEIVKLVREAGGIRKLASALNEGGAAELSRLLREAYKRLHPSSGHGASPTNYAEEHKTLKEVERGKAQLDAKANTDIKNVESLFGSAEGERMINEVVGRPVHPRIEKVMEYIDAVRGENPENCVPSAGEYDKYLREYLRRLAAQEYPPFPDDNWIRASLKRIGQTGPTLGVGLETDSAHFKYVEGNTFTEIEQSIIAQMEEAGEGARGYVRYLDIRYPDSHPGFLPKDRRRGHVFNVYHGYDGAIHFDDVQLRVNRDLKSIDKLGWDKGITGVQLLIKHEGDP